jgi:hypothetical protein
MHNKLRNNFRFLSKSFFQKQIHDLIFFSDLKNNIIRDFLINYFETLKNNTLIDKMKIFRIIRFSNLLQRFLFGLKKPKTEQIIKWNKQSKWSNNIISCFKITNSTNRMRIVFKLTLIFINNLKLMIFSVFWINTLII